MSGLLPGRLGARLGQNLLTCLLPFAQPDVARNRLVEPVHVGRNALCEEILWLIERELDVDMAAYTASVKELTARHNARQA